MHLNLLFGDDINGHRDVQFRKKIKTIFKNKLLFFFVSSINYKFLDYSNKIKWNSEL